MAPIMPLAMMPEGKVSKIISINAGRSLVNRLKSMGFIENSFLKVKKDNMGALIVDLNGCNYALGKGMASKIMVQECTQ
ncbi:MAG: ferrous iron transport protein [Methanolobus sp.]|jgi:ferrous iron transport protein A|nr:ferrous iron transport protein [Methanolobus sp.]MDK2912940.1 ferrous iron transport protein [Methanolobus sp.]MDN5310900.1 ferrous iron transport protein [Methanolobus sp.]